MPWPRLPCNKEVKVSTEIKSQSVWARWKVEKLQDILCWLFQHLLFACSWNVQPKNTAWKLYLWSISICVLMGKLLMALGKQNALKILTVLLSWSPIKFSVVLQCQGCAETPWHSWKSCNYDFFLLGFGIVFHSCFCHVLQEQLSSEIEATRTPSKSSYSFLL